MSEVVVSEYRRRVMGDFLCAVGKYQEHCIGFDVTALSVDEFNAKKAELLEGLLDSSIMLRESGFVQEVMEWDK